MALLKLGGIITSISGKLGGNILGSGINGNYIKSNSYSQQHPSALQSKQRTQLYPVTQIWRTLNSTQKALWAAETVNYPYVNRVGDTVEYTAYQLFCYLNLNLQLIGQAHILVPATYEALSSFSVYSGGDPGNNVKMIIDSGGVNEYFVIYSMKPHSPLYSYNPSLMRFVTYFPYTGSTTNYDWTAAYTPLFGVPFANGNQWTGIKAVNAVTGIASPISQIQIINYS